MTNSAQYILQHLFGEGRLEDVSVDQLKQLVDEYPAFNVGHYLLSIKLQKEKDEDYLSETQRTALYFHNPLWLQWLLKTTEEKPLAHLEEIAAAMRQRDDDYQEKTFPVSSAIVHEEIVEEFPGAKNNEYDGEAQNVSTNGQQPIHENSVNENPVLDRYAAAEEEYLPTKTQEEKVDEQYSPEIKNEEPVREINTQDSAEEPFRETHITENPVFEENVAPVSEYHSPEIKNEEPVEEINAVHTPQEFHVTYITEDSVFEENATPVSEYHSPEIKNEESVQEINTPDHVEEHFHETHITENPVFEENAAPVSEYHSPEIKNEESVQEISTVNNQEEFHETYITENPVFEETATPVSEFHAEEIKHEEPVQEINTSDNIEERFHETYSTENPVFEENAAPMSEYHSPETQESKKFEVEEEHHHIPVIENISPQEQSAPIYETSTGDMNADQYQHSDTMETEEHANAEREIQPVEKIADPSPPVQENADAPFVNHEAAQQPVAQTEDEHETNEFELSFEPYHTIDYFASQGIKFVQEENPTDKFGKQLKTFTDWLKVMKKLPQHVLPEPDERRNAEIEMIAADSLKEKEVETETMAEVLAKQGKTDKAIELYLKLSLLNPTKIAYFASKIEQIKRTLL